MKEWCKLIWGLNVWSLKIRTHSTITQWRVVNSLNGGQLLLLISHRWRIRWRRNPSLKLKICLQDMTRIWEETYPRIKLVRPVYPLQKITRSCRGWCFPNPTTVECSTSSPSTPRLFHISGTPHKQLGTGRARGTGPFSSHSSGNLPLPLTMAQ
jgi:hypothetical protein